MAKSDWEKELFDLIKAYNQGNMNTQWILILIFSFLIDWRKKGE